MDNLLSCDHETWMRLALEQAQLAALADEVPVGAVVVSAENKLIATGQNRVIRDSDPSAHAEMVALREAGQYQQNYRLPGLRLYVTLEPCIMCAGLIIHSRISHLIYACNEPKTGACGSAVDLLLNTKLNHHTQVVSNVLAHESQDLLRNFFRLKRLGKRQ